MSFKDIDLKKKLYLSFACMWAIMLFFAFFRGQQLTTVIRRYDEALRTLTHRQECIGNMVALSNRLRFDDIIMGALNDYPGFYSHVYFMLLDMESRYYYIESLQECFKRNRESVLSDAFISPEDQKNYIYVLDNIEYLFNQHYVPLSDSLITAIVNEDREKVVEVFFQSLPLGNDIFDLIRELGDLSFDFAEYLNETMNHYDSIDESVFNIATVLGISLAVFLAVMMAKNIQKQQESYQAEIRQALKETKLASEAKSSFIANTNHEIRTPMISIIGYSELAMEDPIPDTTKEYLGNVLTNAKWLLNIINDIMDFSKVESGKLELEQISFDLRAVLENGRISVEHQALEKGLRLNVQTDLSPGKQLLGDPVKLTQICINLLSNAVKFTDKGDVSCTVTSLKEDEKRCSLRFEIADTGMGIATERLNSIFEPFTQADTKISRKYGGTGIGLSITKRFVEAMGGNIQVESLLGIGSKFSFELSFDLAKAPDGIPGSDFIVNYMDSPLARPHFDKKKVLIVEDNKMNQGVVYEHIRRLGLLPLIANNGKEAVDIIKQGLKDSKKPFELIFMDLHMPVMDGIEATAIISALDTEIPIIAMTASITTIQIETYINYGFDAFLSKPFTAQDLYKLLLRFLKPSENNTASGEEPIESAAFQRKLQIQFAKSNKNCYADISAAIEAGDLSSAHRLAHTLKSNASLIKEEALQIAAEKLELCLNPKHRAELPSSDLMQALKTELELVLQKLAHAFEDDGYGHSLDIAIEANKEKIKIIVSELEPLLKKRNAQSINYVDALKEFSGTEKLIDHIENFNVKEALEEISTLKSIISK